MRKILFSLISISFLTGCWDAVELNELSLVTGLAVDKGKNYKYELTVEIINPPALQPENTGVKTSTIVFSLEGDSIAELAKRMNVQLTRQLKYSHMRIAVISKELAEEGLLEFIDFFEANREIRNDFNFLVVENAMAKDVLKVNYPIQHASSLKLHAQTDTMVNEWGGDADVRLKDYVKGLASKGREPVLTMLKINGPIEKGKLLDNMQKIDLDTIVVLDGLAIFEGMHYKGTLPVKHVRNFLLTQDKLQNTSITTPCGEDKVMTARIYNAKTEIKAFYKEDVPHINIESELEGRIELIQCPADITKLKAYQELEEKFAKSFQKEIEETIRILQEDFQLDIFGFGEDMERQDNKNFKKVEKDWNKEFSRAEINVNVNLKLRRSGLITNPVFEDIN